ncbi:MAG: hypothetical protein AAGG07_03100 [Planctomycetota bacterium]
MQQDTGVTAATTESAAPAPTPASDPAEAATALYMVAMMGVMLVTVAGLLIALRRARARAPSSDRQPQEARVDAWAEAGRRAETPEADTQENDEPEPEDPER